MSLAPFLLEGGENWLTRITFPHIDVLNEVLDCTPARKRSSEHQKRKNNATPHTHLKNANTCRKLYYEGGSRIHKYIIINVGTKVMDLMCMMDNLLYQRKNMMKVVL